MGVMTIGSQYGKLRKRSLENYCHNKVATAKNRLQQGCFLYETKDNFTPSLAHSIETAEQFRNFKELGLLPTLTEISAYEFTCFDAAEAAVRKINNEITKKAHKPDKKTELPSGIGDNRSGRMGGGKQRNRPN